MKFTSTKLMRLAQLTNRINSKFPQQPVRTELIIHFDAQFLVATILENTLLADAPIFDDLNNQLRINFPRYPAAQPLYCAPSLDFPGEIHTERWEQKYQLALFHELDGVTGLHRIFTTDLSTAQLKLSGADNAHGILYVYGEQFTPTPQS